jgi:hypothetical protein
MTREQFSAAQQRNQENLALTRLFSNPDHVVITLDSQDMLRAVPSIIPHDSYSLSARKSQALCEGYLREHWPNLIREALRSGGQYGRG